MPILRSQTPVSHGISFQRRRPAPTGLNLRTAHAKKVPRGFNKHPTPTHPHLGGQLHYAPEKAATAVVRCSASAVDKATLAAYTRASESSSRTSASSPSLKKQGSSPIVAKIRKVSKRLSMASLKLSPTKATVPEVPALPISIIKSSIRGAQATVDLSLSDSDASLSSPPSSVSSAASSAKVAVTASLTPMFKLSPASPSMRAAAQLSSAKASPLPAWLEDVDAYLADHAHTSYWLHQTVGAVPLTAGLSTCSTAFSIYSVASAMPTPAACASRSPATFAAALQSYAMQSARLSPVSDASSDTSSSDAADADQESLCSDDASSIIAPSLQRTYVRTPWVDGQGYDDASSSSDGASSAADSYLDSDAMTMGTDSAPTSLDEADELHAGKEAALRDSKDLSSAFTERIVWSPDAAIAAQRTSTVKFAHPQRPALKPRSMSHSGIKRPVPPPIVIAASKAIAVADVSSSSEAGSNCSSSADEAEERDITDLSASSQGSFVEVALASVDAALPKVAFKVSTPKFIRRPMPVKRGTQERLVLECERLARQMAEQKATDLHGLQQKSFAARGRETAVKLLA